MIREKLKEVHPDRNPEDRHAEDNCKRVNVEAERARMGIGRAIEQHKHARQAKEAKSTAQSTQRTTRGKTKATPINVD